MADVQWAGVQLRGEGCDFGFDESDDLLGLGVDHFAETVAFACGGVFGLVDSESDIKVRRVKSRVRIRYEVPTRLSWTQEEGDMNSVEAVWELEDLGNERTRVSYTLDADPGRVLGLVIRGPVLAATRAIFVNGRPGELKRHVEGG